MLLVLKPSSKQPTWLAWELKKLKPKESLWKIRVFLNIKVIIKRADSSFKIFKNELPKIICGRVAFLKVSQKGCCPFVNFKISRELDPKCKQGNVKFKTEPKLATLKLLFT